jgi:hypothetical protein
MSKQDDVITSLIVAGVIVAAGLGIFRVIKTIGSLAIGDLVAEADLSRRSVAATVLYVEIGEEGEDFCHDCGTTSPDRCQAYACGVCLICEPAYDRTICYSCHGSIYD